MIVSLIPQQQFHKIFYIYNKNAREFNLIENFKVSIITHYTTCTSSKSTINKFVVVLISINEMQLIMISFVTHKVNLPFKKSSQILR